MLEKILKLFISMIIPLILCIIIGVYIHLPYKTNIILLIIGFIILLSFFIFQMSYIFTKNLVSDTKDDVLAYAKKYQENPKSHIKIVKRIIVIHHMINGLVMTSIVLLFLGLIGLVKDGNALYLFWFLSFLIILFAHYIYYYFDSRYQYHNQYFIEKELYQGLYEKVQTVLDDISLSFNVKIAVNNNDPIYAIIVGKTLYVHFGVEMLLLLDDDELYAIINKEILNEHLLNQSGLGPLKLKMSYHEHYFVNNKKHFILQFLMYYQTYIFTHNKNKLHFSIDSHIDDLLLAFPTYLQSKLNLIKVRQKYQIYQLFLKNPNTLFDKDILAKKPETLFTAMYEELISYFNTRKTQLITLTLYAKSYYDELQPPLIDELHQLGLDTIDVTFEPLSKKNVDIILLLNRMNKVYFDNLQLYQTESIKTYEKDVNNMDEDTLLIELKNAKGSHNHVAYQTIINQIMTFDITRSESYFERGFYKLTALLDSSSIDDFYKSIELNDAFIPDALNYILDAILLFDLDGALKIYEEKSTTLFNFYYGEYIKLQQIDYNDHLIPALIEPKVLDHLIAMVEKMPSILELYLVTKVISDDFNSVMVGIVQNHVIQPDTFDQDLNVIYHYLDKLEDQYALLIITTHGQKKAFKRINNSLKHHKNITKKPE